MTAAPPAGSCRLALADSEATERLGARLARHLPPDAPPLVMYLQGELGAGKTTFARGLLRALGVTGPVRSPTYTLLEHYALARGQALHMDLYRLDDEQEFEQLGAREAFVPGALWLIEWPERAMRSLPGPDLRLHFSLQAAGHEVLIEAGSSSGTAWLAAAMSEDN